MKNGVECLNIIDLIPIVIYVCVYVSVYVRVYVSAYVRVYVSVYVRVPCMWVFMYKREQLNFYDPTYIRVKPCQKSVTRSR